MKTKSLKLTAVAAGAVVLAGAAFAAPSYAAAKHSSVKAASAFSTSTNGAAPTWSGASGDANDGRKGGPRADRLESTIAATITGVPTTVTDLEVAEHGALFMAFEYTDAAPTTQPTTGGHPARFEATALTNGTVTGTLGFLSPKTAGTYKVAVYTSSTDATPDLISIVVDSAGKATASASGALTAAYDATLKAPAFAGLAGGPGFGPGPKDGKGPNGQHGPNGDHGPRGDRGPRG